MSHLVVSIVTKYQDREGNEKSRFSRCGAAFPNKIGGYNLKLDGPIVIVPGQNELVIAEPKDDQPKKRGDVEF